MGIFGFMRTPKPQQYKYVPRYWDPEKETRDERVRQMTGEQDASPEAIKGRISQGFRSRGRIAGRGQNQARRRSNIILLMIVIGLLALAYVFIVSYLPQIVEALE